MSESQEMAGRVAVVTGAASGIGRACARLLAQNGVEVFAADYSHMDENADDFAALGICSVQCDVLDEAQIKSLFEKADGSSGSVDILINSAGVGMVKQVPEVTMEDWNRCMGTNVTAAFCASKMAIVRMIRSGGGAIVNIASNAGLLPRAHDPVYSISKASLIALTKSMALCHAKDGIRVNAICPGPVEATRMIDAEIEASGDPVKARESLIRASPLARAAGRMISPREIAQSALYLVSDQAAMITGTSIGIDGGKSLGIPPVP